MRKLHLFSIGLIGVLAVGAAPAQAQFTVLDWLVHRGNNTQSGANGDPGLAATRKLNQAWVYPAPADMPAEIVVDNTTLPSTPPPIADNQGFTVAGAWTYPAVSNRASGLWPFTDVTPTKIGDYVYTSAVFNQTLANIGIDTLSKLPNLGDDQVEPVSGKNTYARIHDQLVADTKTARWYFGRKYPTGSRQGTLDASGKALQANQRYAIYIRFPSSSTLEPSGTGTVARPAADHTFVRVSWGSNLNDPIKSRIFMLNSGDTGDFWTRIRTSASDDRYFPYDGTNPIVVTMYSVVPDAQPNSAGVATTIVADAVRLVPESGRGEIQGPAASAVFPPGGGANAVRRTYFGRNETTGPPALFPTLGNVLNTPIGGFPTIPYNPALPPNANQSQINFNPYIADPTQSIRSAVFYCMEDDQINQRYGKLIWRHVAKSSANPTYTIDDLDGSPTYSSTPFANVPPGFQTITPGAADPDQPFRTTYQTSPAQNTVPPPTASASPVPPNARWTQALPYATTYSVFVWIPGGNPLTAEFAQQAYYRLQTSSGAQDVVLDQRNTGGTQRIGMWRRLASGVRFPSLNATQVTATVTLYNYSPVDTAAGRVVAADAIQFVPESTSRNSVVAAPLVVANVKWPNAGFTRSVVYFATTDGHLWALDALGNYTAANPSTLTTPYWVYPSISNPNTAQKPAAAAFEDQYDPNFLPDAGHNSPANQGIDADLIDTVIRDPNNPNQFITVKVAGNKTPDLSAFTSSPMYVEVEKGVVPTVTRTPYIVLGNQNGRIYAFDPAGRVNEVAANGPVGQPFNSTLSTGDNPGVPGTTRRLLTWPSTGRDKWLRKGGLTLGSNSFANFPSDPSKVSFSATLSAPLMDAQFKTDRLVAGAGDGHVYAVDLDSVDPLKRISNETNDGAPKWQYPDPTTQIDPILLPGALTTTNKYIFSAGGRVYAVDNPNTTANGLAAIQWVYPYTATPPNNPNAGDLVRSDLPYTAPVWRANVGALNSGKEVAFVANQSGSIIALDASAGPNANPAVVWSAPSYGNTRANLTFLNYLEPMTGITTGTPGPALLLPLDTGELIGVHAINSGFLTWDMADGAAGFVPVTDTVGNVVAQPTNFVFRGADAITANGWVYQGDEGNPNTGELNGQMRAYADEIAVGFTTPGVPRAGTRDQGTLDIRLVELWDAVRDNPTANPANPWDALGITKSPYKEWVAGKAKANTQNGIVVYEWGDTLFLAAWGTYTGTILPSVDFFLEGGSAATSRISGNVHVDPDPPANLTGGVTPWVAVAQISLGRGSANNPQTPGTSYHVRAQARLTTAGGSSYLTPRMYPGQRTVTTSDPNPQGNFTENNMLGAPRQTAIAHPLAMTTRSVPAGTPVGPNFSNIIGWTTGIPVTNAGADLTEALSNGLNISAVTGQTISTVSKKDLSAPIAMGNHGKTSAYAGINIDANGRPVQVPAFFVADRSNLWKQNQPLNNVRVERREMRWHYNPNLADPLRRATGDALNPLPFDDFLLAPAYRFPKNTPNTSVDYPDIDRTRTQIRANGVDMSTRPITLPLAQNNNGTKVLQGLPLDMTVDIPAFQPANVSTAYQDVMGRITNTFYGPMYIPTGQNVASGPNAAVRQLVSPSGGYVGSFAVYVDNNNNGRFEDNGGAGTTQVAGQISREEVFRSLNVGVGVAPDLSMRAEEETLDLGRASHSMGYAPGIPFAPSYMGPYAGALSPFDSPGLNPYFIPFTTSNRGNVNLVNVRIAKYTGNGDTSIAIQDTTAIPAFWWRATSDQVDVFVANNIGDPGKIWGPRINTAALLGGPAAGLIGLVSSLDHGRGPLHNIFDLENPYGGTPLWPYGLLHAAFPAGNPYVENGNLFGWTQGINPAPSIHKARPGDVAATVLSIPDVAYGDPFGVLATLRATGREIRPSIGLAVPLGTPAGTYSSSVIPFEDHMPIQWREWQDTYRNLVGGGPSPVDFARDGDGVLNLQVDPATRLPVGPPVEPAVSNPFKLKVTVQEARLTNGQSALIAPGNYLQEDRTYSQIDIRPGGTTDFGANLQPVALRDSNPNHANLPILLFWPTNRRNNLGPAPTIQDTPWTLAQSQLNGIGQQPNNNFPLGLYDWRYEPITGGLSRWWNPLPAASQFPPLSLAPNLFPSQQSQVLGNPNTPLVPGVIVTNSQGEPMVRHATPSLAQNDLANADKTILLFWQGSAYKNAGTGAESFSLDSRTFYVPLTYNSGSGQHEPNLGANGGVPFSFLNDPALPKFGPKPVVMTTSGGQTSAFLIWYGGGRGRTRLYFNTNTGALNDPTLWSRDTALNTPGSLQYIADPSPVVRRNIFTTQFNANGSLVDAIDVSYTGMMPHRKQPETFLTRYAVEQSSTGTPNGKLTVMQLPQAANELLVRDGTSQTWSSRDIAWVYRDPQTRALVDNTGNSPFIIISVNGVRINTGAPTFDEATGKLYFSSTLGGQVAIDPQSGLVTFTGIAPRTTDRVTGSYIPQTMRLNVTRNDSGVITAPGGWQNDPGFQSIAHVAAPGANAGPVSFIDRSANPKLANVIPGPGNAPATVTRYWTLFRKTGPTVAGNAAIYYKTMRLMVRLPRTVLRDLLANGTYTIGNHVRVTGNRGPVEVDWTRGRLYFTEIDEGSEISVEFDYARDNNGNVQTVPVTTYRVGWGDEISTAIVPGDQSISETVLPTETQVNEGQISAFKDPFQNKVWVFWSSTRAGTTDLYYMAISPQFYPLSAAP